MAEEGAAPQGQPVGSAGGGSRASGGDGARDNGSSGREADQGKPAELPVDKRDRIIFHIIMSLGAWYMAMLLTNWAGRTGYVGVGRDARWPPPAAHLLWSPRQRWWTVCQL